MSINNVIDFVKKYAPTLGLALSSPAGAAVALTNVVSSAFGEESGATKDLLKKMQEDPEAKSKLLQIQQDYDLKCKQIIADMSTVKFNHDEEIYKTDAQDRDSARKANAGNQNNNKRDWIPSIIAVLVVIGFYASIGTIMAVKNDPADKDILYMMLGVLGTAFISIINYYFGSSAGSRNKDDSINNITKSIKMRRLA